MIERLREDLLRSKGVEGLKTLDFLGYMIGRDINECQSSTSDELIKGNNKKVFLSENGLRLTIKSEENPIIVGVFLTRALLDNLGICTESDLEQFFGKPDSKEKRMGTEFYFYNQPGIYCERDYRKNLFIGVGVGDLGIFPRSYTAKSLLHNFLKWQSDVTRIKELQASDYPKNKNYDAKLLILLSLMKALELDCPIEELRSGGFVNNRAEHFNEKLSEIVKEDIDIICGNNERFTGALRKFTDQRGVKTSDLRMIYSFLFGFYVSLKAILSYNSGWLEAGSVGSQYCIHKVSQVLSGFDREKFVALENLLCGFLDPLNRVFTQKELVEKYGYPDVDIALIEMHEW